MSAIDNRGCDRAVERVAEAFAALAVKAEPACSGVEGEDAFEQLRRCLMRRGQPATTMGPNRIQ